MHGQVWDLVFQTIVKITLPRVIPTLTYHSDILSDILILSGILPRIYSDILPGILSGISSEILCG